MSSAVKPIHTIHVGGEETGLMEPVNVIVTKPSTATTGIKTTFQSFKTYIANLGTQFGELTVLGKLVLIGFIVLIVSGIVLIVVLNVKLHYPSGTVTTCNLTYSWSSTGTAFVNDTQLDTPQSIYINSGTIYISDAADTPIIRSISVSGTTVSTFISSTSLANPQAIYIDQSNDVYIPDYDNACVYKFTTTGSLVTPTSVAAGDDGNPGSELNQLNGPMHIAFDAAETYMFVADSNNNRIIRFSTTASPNSDGVVVASNSDNGISQPSGLYYDSTADYLYIANSQSNVVVKWKPLASSGTIIAGSLNTAGSSASLFYAPGGVFYDTASKNLYVADIGNSRIMAYCDGNSAGKMIAGTGVAGSSTKQLSNPYEFVFDSSWNLYIIESGNNRIMKYTRI